MRLGSEYAGLDFWLSSISCHAPGAPIFIVGTHVDEVSKFTLNQAKLKEKYKQIAGFHFVSNVSQAGVEELSKQLIQTTLQEKYMGEALPVIYFILIRFRILVKKFFTNRKFGSILKPK